MRHIGQLIPWCAIFAWVVASFTGLVIW